MAQFEWYLHFMFPEYYGLSSLKSGVYISTARKLGFEKLFNKWLRISTKIEPQGAYNYPLSYIVIQMSRKFNLPVCKQIVTNLIH